MEVVKCEVEEVVAEVVKKVVNEAADEKVGVHKCNLKLQVGDIIHQLYWAMQTLMMRLRVPSNPMAGLF